MRFFVLAFVLLATPALAQSLPGQQASKLVLLAGEDAAKPSAIIPPPPPSSSFAPLEDPFIPVYRRMASMQLQLLELQIVSLSGPIALTAIGASGALIGVVMMLLGAASYGFFIVGLVVLAVSSLPLLIGIPWLVGASGTNTRINAAIEKVKRDQRLLGGVSSRSIEPVDGAVLGTF